MRLPPGLWLACDTCGGLLACALLLLLCLCIGPCCGGSEQSVLFFEVLRPPELRYTYEVMVAKNVGPAFGHRRLPNVRLVYAHPELACSPLLNADEARGSVVLAERGECSFVTKAMNAQEAGAHALIVTQSSATDGDDRWVEMVADDTERSVDIPAVYLPGSDGRMLRKHMLYKATSVYINIPLNLTHVPLDMVRKPPWDLW